MKESLTRICATLMLLLLLVTTVACRSTTVDTQSTASDRTLRTSAASSQPVPQPEADTPQRTTTLPAESPLTTKEEPTTTRAAQTTKTSPVSAKDVNTSNNTTRTTKPKPKPVNETKPATSTTTKKPAVTTTNAPLEEEEERNVGLNYAWIRSLVQKWVQQDTKSTTATTSASSASTTTTKPPVAASPTNPELTTHKDGINASDVLINKMLWELQGTKRATYGQLMPQKSTFANTGEYRHDIVASAGTPLYAITDGTLYHYVSYETINGKRCYVSYGKWVMLAGSDGATLALYAHLQDFSHFSYTSITQTKVQTEGKSTTVACLGSRKVKKGDLIGYIGTTGNSHGPHLHFELYIGGKRVDPSKYVQ